MTGAKTQKIAQADSITQKERSIKMEVQTEKVCVVYGLGSKILAVQSQKRKVESSWWRDKESIDQDTNSVSVKDSQSGLTEHVNISEIRSIELTKEFLDDAVALGKWYQNSNGGFEMQSESIPKPAYTHTVNSRYESRWLRYNSDTVSSFRTGWII